MKGRYWSRTPLSEEIANTLLLYKSNGRNISEIEGYPRHCGLPIRPVYVAPVKSVRLRSKSQLTFEESQSTEALTPTDTYNKGSWMIMLGDDLKRATIYYAAYLTALAIKDADAATALLGIAKDLIEN